MERIFEEKAVQIVIPDWKRRESPELAEFCEIINEALRVNPSMSLAAFASQIHEAHIEESYQRLMKIVNKQLGGMA